MSLFTLLTLLTKKKKVSLLKNDRDFKNQQLWTKRATL